MEGQSEAKFLDKVGKTFGNVKVLGFYKVVNKKSLYYTVCLSCDKESIRRIDRAKADKHPKYCKFCQKDSFIKAKSTTPLNSLYGGYRTGAKTRNLEFSISKEEFKELVIQKCFYCENDPEETLTSKRANRSTTPFKHNGIDRIDSLKGYSLENLVPCCGKCNLMKNKFSKEEFFKQIEKIYELHLRKSSTTIP